MKHDFFEEKEFKKAIKDLSKEQILYIELMGTLRFIDEALLTLEIENNKTDLFNSIRGIREIMRSSNIIRTNLPEID